MSNPFNEIQPLVNIILVPSPFTLCFLPQVVKIELHLNYPYIFVKSFGKMSVSLKNWLYNYVDSPPYFCTHFVSLFNCVDIFNINVHFLFVRFVLLFIFTIILHFIASLGFCSDVFIIL